MHPRRFLPIAAALTAALALASTFAAAPPAPKASPAEAVVPTYMEAMRVGDWQKAGTLLHPEALAEMRQVFVALTAADPTGQAAQQLFGLKPGETLETLPPGEVYARFMSALVTQTEGLKDLLASTRVETLGSVSESSGLSHVVYRLTRSVAGEAPTVQVEVMTIKKFGSDWRSMVPPELQGILSSIRSTIAQRDAMMRQNQQAEPFPSLDLATDPNPVP
jgi:hypothetical protein